MDQELVSWFQSLASHTVLSWSVHIVEEQWSDYLDIHVREIEKALLYNWAFTLGLPGEEDADVHTPYDLEGRWSADAVTAALNQVVHSIGRTDIMFVYNPQMEEPEYITKVRKLKQDYDKGNLTMFNLGDNVHVSENVMDFLLEDLDRAAKIVGKMKYIAKDLMQ